VSAPGVRRLDLFVTERCNLACNYCFAAAGAAADPSEQQCLQAIDWLVLQSEADHLHVTFWGGEPLLRKPLLRRLVRHAQRQAHDAGKTVSFSLPTNASLVDDETVAWIERRGIEVFLSIDGDARAQRARPLRSGGCSHERVAAGMRRALSQRWMRAKVPALRLTVAPDDAGRLADNVRYFAAHGAQQLHIYPAQDQLWSRSQLSGYERGQRELAEWLIERVAHGADQVAVPALGAWQPILRRLFDGVPVRQRSGLLRHCGAGGELVALGTDGRLWPCHRFIFYARRRGEDLSLGSIAGGIDGRRSARYAAIAREQLHGTERCVECDIYDLCTHGCMAINYATTGELAAVGPAACALMRTQVEACHSVHEALAGDPAYAAYLGRPATRSLAHAAAKLGARALAAYQLRGCAQSAPDIPSQLPETK